MKTLQDYTSDIIQYQNAIKLDPNNAVEYKYKIGNIIGKWQDLLDITIFIASNEQLPYQEHELNHKVRSMPTKAMSGYEQVGDYHAYVDGFGGYYLPFVVDRKTCNDFYGTLFGNRQRFYNEIERFREDNRFSDMFVFVECNLLTWLNYEPPNPQEKGNLRINQKLSTIASLESRGCHVVWCGTRTAAIHLYRDFVRQYCIRNYESILKI